jgi:hypothetical protein
MSSEVAEHLDRGGRRPAVDVAHDQDNNSDNDDPTDSDPARCGEDDRPPSDKKKRRKKKKHRNKSKKVPGPARPGLRNESVCTAAPGKPACDCSLWLCGRRTTCNVAAPRLAGIEDRVLRALNDVNRRRQEWSAVVASGQAHLTRFANLLLQSEQLSPDTFAAAFDHGAARSAAGGGAVWRSSVSSGGLSTVLHDATAKRGVLLARIQADLLNVHDHLVSLHQRYASTVSQVAEDAICCQALQLQACKKSGWRPADFPMFKTLRLGDLSGMLNRIDKMYEQELVLK